MATKIAINGFGRIGRCVARAAIDRNAETSRSSRINDLTDAETLAHLLKYDSRPRQLRRRGRGRRRAAIVIDGKKIERLRREGSRRSCRGRTWASTSCSSPPASSPSATTAAKHLDAGAKKVIISRPGEGRGRHHRASASTTTSTTRRSTTSSPTRPAPPTAWRRSPRCSHDTFGIERGLMTTIHAYTNDQRILDLPHKDLRRARAAALSMIPTTTGAAKAVGLVLPELKGKLDGFAMRVPTPNVSRGRPHRATLDEGRHRGGDQRRAARPRPRARSRASSAYTDEPTGLASTSSATRTPRSSTRTYTMVIGEQPASRSWPGTTTSGASRNRMVDLMRKLIASKGM